jgi:cell division septation protein DedD
MNARVRSALLAFALVLVCGPVSAQSDVLDRVDGLLAAGRLTDARSTLARWIAANPPGARAASPEDRARARLLEGRLTPDVASAEEAYRSVVLSYPRTRAAPEAMLRLGQVLVAVAMADADSAAARRAVDYLDRLVDDYPGSEHRTLGMLWLARAHEVVGDHPSACAVTADALRAGIADPVMNGLFETEREAACNTSLAGGRPDDAARAGAARAPTQPPARRTERAPPVRPDPPTGQLERFAVQAAALRDRAGADALVARLRRAGFDPRVVRLEGSTLHRVRLGRYTGTPPAAQLARRVRQAGFDAVVVTDAHREVR